MPAFAAVQQPKSLIVTANGEGTLRVGREEFKVHAAVVKLLEDGKCEITLVSDITIFVSGNWSRDGNDANEIALKITGGPTQGGVEGSGKLLLREDGKTIASLTLQAMNKVTKRNVEVDFRGH
jgi:hypothetical protein